MRKRIRLKTIAWFLVLSLMLSLWPLLPKVNAEDINYISSTYDASEDVENLLTAVGTPSDMSRSLRIPNEYVGYETTARAFIIDSEINNLSENPRVYLKYTCNNTSEDTSSTVKVDEGCSGWTTLSFTPTSDMDEIRISYDGSTTSDGFIEMCKLELQRDTLLPISALAVQNTDPDRRITVQEGTAVGRAKAFHNAFNEEIENIDLSGHSGLTVSFHAYMVMNGTGSGYTTENNGLSFFAVYNDGTPSQRIGYLPNSTTCDTAFSFSVTNNVSHLETIRITYGSGPKNEWHISQFKIEPTDPSDNLGKEAPYDMMPLYASNDPGASEHPVTMKNGQVYEAPLSALRDIRIPIPSNYYSAIIESPIRIIKAESVDPYQIRYEHDLFDIGLLERNTLITVSDGEAVGQARSFHSYFSNGISALDLQGHDDVTVSLDAYVTTNGITTGSGLAFYAVYNDGSKSFIGSLPNTALTEEHFTFAFHNDSPTKHLQSLAIQNGTAGIHNVWHLSNFKITDPSETVSTATEVRMGTHETRLLNDVLTLRYAAKDANEALALGGEFTQTLHFEPLTAPICTFIVEPPRVVNAPLISLNSFTDLNPADWYYDAVSFVVNHQLMNGVTPTQFAPNANADELALYTVLYRMEENYIAVFGIPVPPRGEQTDPEADSAPEPERSVTTYNKLEWAILNDFMPRPEKAATASVTREEAVITLYRYAVAKGADVSQLDDLSGFTDTQQCSAEGRHAFAWAVEAGIISGVSGGTQLSPNTVLTRAQLAAMVSRFVNANCVNENQDHVHRYVVSGTDWRHAKTDCDEGLSYWYRCLDCSARSTYQYFELTDKYTQKTIKDEHMDHHSYTMRDPSPDCQRTAATGNSCATYYFRCKNCGKIYNGSNENGYYNHSESAPNALLPPQNTGSQGLFTNANQYRLTYATGNYSLEIAREWHYDSWCYLAKIHFLGTNSDRFASLYTKTAGELFSRTYQSQTVSGYSVGQIVVLRGVR